MNKKRRKAIEEIWNKIEETKNSIENIKDEENEFLENIPENLCNSDKYSESESACDALSSAMDSMDEVIGYLETAKE